MIEQFDIDAFNAELAGQVKNKKLSERTKNYYVACLENINSHIRAGQIEGGVARIVDTICGGNEQGAKYIAAIKKYERDILESPKSILYGEDLIRLREKYKQRLPGREPALGESTYSKKINRLGNMKLELALRLQHKSGLRVSEIASLEKEDFVFLKGNTIRLTVRSGKGRKARIVDMLPDEYLFHRLQGHLAALEDGEKVFYSRSYLQKKAGKLDLRTHDLRRINARERFHEQRVAGAGRREARREVQKQLGHEKPHTTNAYLGKVWNSEEEGDD